MRNKRSRTASKTKTKTKLHRRKKKAARKRAAVRSGGTSTRQRRGPRRANRMPTKQTRKAKTETKIGFYFSRKKEEAESQRTKPSTMLKLIRLARRTYQFVQRIRKNRTNRGH